MMTELDRIDKEEQALNELHIALMSVLTHLSDHTRFYKECLELFVETTNRLEFLTERREKVISSAETSGEM